MACDKRKTVFVAQMRESLLGLTRKRLFVEFDERKTVRSDKKKKTCLRGLMKERLLGLTKKKKTVCGV